MHTLSGSCVAVEGMSNGPDDDVDAGDRGCRSLTSMAAVQITIRGAILPHDERRMDVRNG